MKWPLVSVMFAVCTRVDSFAVSHIISNYAKVSVNDGNQHNVSTATPQTLTNDLSKNETDDEIPEYEDFDDNTASPERSSQTAAYDKDTMMNYFNGFVNLLALMYKFSGNADKVKPESLHFSKSRPRSSDGIPLANSVNQLAEDRYNPNTAAKKFRAKQSAGAAPSSYSSMNVYPVYSPSSAADSYSSNDGKTSYDSDSSQYMINNPEDMEPSQKPGMDSSYKPKSPMTDYISQNDPVDIQQSYSYEIPQEPEKTMEEHGGMQSWDAAADEDPMEDIPKYSSWKSPVNKKPPNVESWEDVPKEKPQGPVFYSWMKNSKKKMKPPVEPMEEEDQEDQWNGNPKQNNIKDSLYYPWLSSKNPKPVPPPPEEDVEEDDHPSWGMKPPAKSKPPKNFDDHHYPYLDDHDDTHGLIYHDDHLDHEEEEDHDLKDEDRESKRPYTYYHLGRKLWYVPLLFSLYFIVYIASLILKSIARHKVQFPEKLWDLHDHHHHDEHGRKRRQINEMTDQVYSSIEKLRNKYM